MPDAMYWYNHAGREISRPVFAWIEMIYEIIFVGIWHATD